jgi:GAF domain-containing protein
MGEATLPQRSSSPSISSLLRMSLPSHHSEAVLLELPRCLLAAEDEQQVGECAIEAVATALQADASSLLLVDPDGQLKVRAARGWPAELVERLAADSSLNSQVWYTLQRHRPAAVENYAAERNFAVPAVVLEHGLVSGLSMPLISGEGSLGVILVQWRTPRRCGEPELFLLSLIAGQTVIALEKAHLYESQVREAEISRAMLEVAQAAQAATTTTELMQALVTPLMAQIGCDRCALFVWDEVTRRFNLNYSYSSRTQGQTAREVLGSILVKEAPLAANVLKLYKPWVVLREDLERQLPPAWVEKLKLRSVVIAPLRDGDHLIGALALDNSLSSQSFTPRALAVVEGISQQLAVNIQKMELFQTVQHQLEELTVLHAIATVGTEATSEDTLIYKATETIGSSTLFPTNFGVLLLEEATGDLHVHPSYRDTFNEVIPGIIPAGQGVTGQVVLTGQPLRIPDVSQEPAYVLASTRTQSELCVPLKVGDRVLGVINAESARLNAFTEADERLLVTVAGQLATAMEKVRLLEAEREQRELAEALLEAGTILGSTLDLDEVLDRLLEQVGRVVPYDSANVMLVEGQWVRIARLKGYERFGAQVAQAAATASFNIAQTANLRWMLENKQPLLIPDTAAYPGWLKQEIFPYVRCWVGAPIIIRTGEVVAFFSLDKAEPGFYQPKHVKRLNAFVGQAALAIQNARLYREIKQRADVLISLNQASQAVISSLDRQEVLDLIVALAGRVLGSVYTSVVLVNEDGSMDVSAENFEGIPPLEVRARPGGVTQRILTTNQPLVFDEVSLGDETHNPSLMAGGVKSYAGVPLLAGGHTLGVFLVHSTSPAAFSSQLPLVMTFANQVAIALENAKLYESLESEKRRLELLYNLSQNLITTLNPREVANRALRQICEVFGAFQGWLFITQPGTDQLRLLSATNADPQRIEEMNQRLNLRLRQGLAGWAAAQRTVMIVEDVSLDPHWQSVPALAADERVRSVVSIPLVAGDELVGVFDLHGDRLQSFHPEQIPILRAAAAPVAVALQNARLFEETDRHAREVTAASDILHALNAMPDVSLAFSAIAANIRGITGCERVSLTVFDENETSISVLAVDDPHPDSTLRFNRGMRFAMSATSSTADILAGRLHLAPALNLEIQFPIERELYEAGYRSRINLPLHVAGEQIIGSLNLLWSYTGGYGQSNLALLGQIADAVALALEKSRLLEKTRRRDVILEALAYTGERLLMPGHMGEVLPSVLMRLGRAADVSRAYLFENYTLADGEVAARLAHEWLAPGRPQAAAENSPWPTLAYNSLGLQRWSQTLGTGHLLYGGARDFPEEEKPRLQERGIRSLALAPIFSGGVWWGFIGFDDCDHERVWSAAEIEAIKSAADVLGVAFARQRSEIAEREQRALFEALRDTAAALNSTLNFDEVLDRILTNVGRVVPHDAATIMLSETGIARVVRSRGYAERGLESWLQAWRFQVTKVPSLRRMMETGRPLAIPDTEAYPGWGDLPEARWVRSYAGAPIWKRGRLIGFINLDSATPGFYTPIHAERLQAFSDQAAIAIENAQLYDTIRQHAEELEQRVADRTRELESANERLRELDRLKDQFVTNVSHELRTPLTNIGLYLNLLDKRRGEGLERYLPILKSETERLKDLIEDLLALSRIDQGRLVFAPQPYSLDSLILEVMQAQAARAETKGLRIWHRPNRDVPAVAVDYSQMLQVLINLLGNAIAYTPTGGHITITTALAQRDEKWGVTAQFHNDGPIIPVEDLPHIFERFYRGGTGRDSGEPGTGLGLAICKEIVERHRGRITADSSEVDGTTFTVWLPLTVGG